MSALVTLTSLVTLTFGSRSQKIYKVVRRYEMHLSTKNEANTSSGYGMVSNTAKHSIAANTATFQCLHAKSSNLWHANLRHRKANLGRILYFRIWGSKKFLYTIGIMIIVYMWVLYGVLRTFQPALVDRYGNRSFPVKYIVMRFFYTYSILLTRLDYHVFISIFNESTHPN